MKIRNDYIVAITSGLLVCLEHLYYYKLQLVLIALTTCMSMYITNIHKKSNGFRENYYVPKMSCFSVESMKKESDLTQSEVDVCCGGVVTSHYLMSTCRQTELNVS